MQLSRGMAVFAEADRFGVLVDVVVDPFSSDVTHVVVDPCGDHQQNRLIPLWLVSEVRDGLRVALPDTHVRQLQRCLESDYVRRSADVVTTVKLVGLRSVLALPHFADPKMTSDADPATAVSVSACEIRRSSWVVGEKARVLGTVAGLIVDGDLAYAVIVRSGIIGHRHKVAVPMHQVERVSSHFLTLTIDRDEFKKLPLTVAGKAGIHFLRPQELWREVLGRPTNQLWDSFEIDPMPTVASDDNAEDDTGR